MAISDKSLKWSFPSALSLCLTGITKNVETGGRPITKGWCGTVVEAEAEEMSCTVQIPPALKHLKLTVWNF